MLVADDASDLLLHFLEHLRSVVSLSHSVWGAMCVKTKQTWITNPKCVQFVYAVSVYIIMQTPRIDMHST